MSDGIFTCKIVLLGEGRVGKTSLRRSYLGKNFLKSYNMTIGADFAVKSVSIGNYNLTVNLWDLSGQSKFKILRESYYRGASGAILVYSIDRKDTFESLDNWVIELIKNNEERVVPMLVIANKIDLDDKRVDTASGVEYARYLSEKFKLSIQYVEASALTGENVEKAFETLFQNIIDETIKKSRKDKNVYL